MALDCQWTSRGAESGSLPAAASAGDHRPDYVIPRDLDDLMQLYFFLLVVLSLSSASVPSMETPMEKAALATMCMLGSLILISHIAARACWKQIETQQIEPLLGAELFERQMNAFRWLGLGIVLLCLTGFGLATATVQSPMLKQSLCFQAVVLLMPGLTITLSTWSAEHYYRSLTGLVEQGLRQHLAGVWLRFRGTMGWLVVPILLLLAMSDLIAGLELHETHTAIITMLGVLIFVPFALPWLIRFLFKTAPVHESAEKWFESIISAAGIRRTSILCWRTDNRAFNAMIVGFIPSFRTLLISDRLMNELPRPQLAMVVLHEVAHLKRFHVPLRMLSIVPAWLLGGLITRMAEGHSWAIAAGSGVSIAMTLVILRLAATRTEFDADLQACNMAVRVSQFVKDVPSTYDEASRAMEEALRRITLESHSARKASWLHPSVSQRIAALKHRTNREESGICEPEPRSDTAQATATLSNVIHST